MATEVSTIDTQDRIDELANKACGILSMMARVKTDDVLPENAVRDSSWAVEGMVREIQKLATGSEA